MKKIGLIVNPIAGIGGSCALKGSDGELIQRQALQMGARPQSGNKTAITLQVVADHAETDYEFLTCSGEMGEKIIKTLGIPYRVVVNVGSETTVGDTMRAALELRDQGVDLLLFSGGDGTARNILDSVGTTVTSLGIPTGVKIHSGVYAINPRKAGELVVAFLQNRVQETKLAEVMDIDENLFRNDIIDAKLYGYLQIPNEVRLVQNMKSGRGLSEKGSLSMICNNIIDTIEEDVLYIVGTGSTMLHLMDLIDADGTLLGVDLLFGRELVAKDVTANDILTALDKYPKAQIIVTVIGGQGFVFGRGNQQISAEVIRRVGKENIRIIATKGKMTELFGKNLYADTGDLVTNKYLCGYYKVLVAYGEYHMFYMSD